MEDFEIVDLMETLEDIGHETQEAFKVDGTLVPNEIRKGYSIIPKGNYTYSELEGNESYSEGYSSYSTNYEYTTYETEAHRYSVDFKTQFIEHFQDKIKSMGESYFYLDTSESGHPSFTIWGNTSGIIKLKKAVKMKFPDAEILEVSEFKK